MNGKPDLKPFTVFHKSIMKAQRILSNKGGGCRTTFFCNLCSCTRDELVSFKIGDLEVNKDAFIIKCDFVIDAALLEELELELGD
jgi:hypothetical protein